MARTTVAPQVLTATYYPATPLAGASADIAWVPSDTVNNNDAVIVDGKTMLFAFNDSGGALTLTIHSVVDAFGRLGDITTYSVADGVVAHYGPFKTAGWANSGKLQFDGSAVGLTLAIIQLP